MARGTQSFADADLTTYALLNAVNIMSIDASATHMPMRYRLARDSGSKKPSRRFEPFPFGPGSFPPGPTPFFVTGLVLVTIAAITACYLRTRVCLHHEVLRRPRHRKFIRPSIDCRSDPGEIVVRRRRSCVPLQRGSFPRIVADFLPFEDAPK